MAHHTPDVLATYGRKHIFSQKLQKGYTEFCFGHSPWNKGGDVVLWVFFHPDGRICTFEFHKTRSSVGTLHQMPFGESHTVETFAQYVARNDILLSEKKNLQTFVEHWRSREISDPDDRSFMEAGER